MAYTGFLHLGYRDFDRMPVFIGSQKYPREIRLRVAGDEGEPLVGIDIALRTRTPTVMGLFIGIDKPLGAIDIGETGDKEVREDDVAYWPLTTVACNIYARWAHQFQEDDEGFYLAAPVPIDTPEKLATIRELGGTCPAPELWAVARAFRENADGKPIHAVQHVGKYQSYKTAARRVQQAREAGYLPPAAQGKRQG